MADCERKSIEITREEAWVIAKLHFEDMGSTAETWVLGTCCPHDGPTWAYANYRVKVLIDAGLLSVAEADALYEECVEPSMKILRERDEAGQRRERRDERTPSGPEPTSSGA